MPLVLDNIDRSLIKALLQDGRRSYRQLAKIANVSTPTAEARIKRMINLGFIRNITPVFDLERIGQGVSAIICLKVAPVAAADYTAYLSSLDEVRSVLQTTGDCNVMVKVACSSNGELQSILDTKICGNPGVSLVNSYVVTRTVKDEQGFPLKSELVIGLKCDYCGGEIRGTPLKLRVGEGERYLCCKTCLASYKEKYGSRISRLEVTEGHPSTQRHT